MHESIGICLFSVAFGDTVAYNYVAKTQLTSLYMFLTDGIGKAL